MGSNTYIQRKYRNIKQLRNTHTKGWLMNLQFDYIVTVTAAVSYVCSHLCSHQILRFLVYGGRERDEVGQEGYWVADKMRQIS